MEVSGWRKPVRFLLDMIYPRSCPGCGCATAWSEPGICWDCMAGLSVISVPLCRTCGEAVHGRVDHEYECQACSTNRPHYDRARAAILYNRLGKQLVTQFKYNHALWLERQLVDFLDVCYSTHFGDVTHDAVCAVPLHAVKRRERGFNQSQLLAAVLARRLDLPLVKAGHLVRTRLTPSQTRLTARQRLSNVMGAFEARPAGQWAGKRLLLVDDVMTTGATVSACAKALKKAGAEAVDVVTVARGI